MTADESEIIAAYKEGRLRVLVAARAYGEDAARRAFEDALVRLHGGGAIDAISVLTDLSRQKSRETRFFAVQRVFEGVLPRLDSDVAVVMNAVVDVLNAGEGDGAAAILIDPFSNFCAARDGRTEEALAVARNEPDRFAVLLPAIILAGARGAREIWFEKLLGLMASESPAIVRHACFTLGRMDLAGDSALVLRAFAALEACAECTSDDGALANIVRSTFALRPERGAFDKNAESLLDRVLSAGGDLTLHAAVETAWVKHAQIDPEVLALLLRHAERVNPEWNGTMEALDLAVSSHLGEPGESQAIAFFQRFAVAHGAQVGPERFDNFLRKLCGEHRDVFGCLIVRWFLSGESALCAAIRWAVMNVLGENEGLPVEPIASEALDGRERVFVARKAIGHLFFRPKAATEIILALMRDADKKSAGLLEEHLFDPMLVNYAGGLEPFLKDFRQTTTPEVKRHIHGALKKWRAQIEGVRSAGRIKELAPSDRERAISRERFADESAAAMREAEKNSILLHLVSKAVILHGSASIHSVWDPSGKKRRGVTHMQSHSYSIDIPSQEMVDPFGLDYMLRVFRAERIA